MTRTHRNRLASCALTLLFALVTSSAWATDGVSEINQTCAELTGCFPGDVAGYPVTISNPGSYRLTSNLITPNENTSGIEYDANDVSIDLNNFGIIRSGCQNNSLCTPISGDGFGIRTPNFDKARVSIKNGRVIGMGAAGIQTGPLSQIADMQVSSNGSYGIYTTRSIIERSFVSLNSGDGIIAPGGTTILNCKVYANAGTGIAGNDAATISGNSVSNNSFQGINAGRGAILSKNNVFQNRGGGVSVTDGSTVSDNTIRDNISHGVVAGRGSHVIGNTVYSNTGYGLLLFSDPPASSYRDNIISSNTLGTVQNGLDMLGNACDGTTTCP